MREHAQHPVQLSRILPAKFAGPACGVGFKRQRYPAGGPTGICCANGKLLRVVLAVGAAQAARVSGGAAAPLPSGRCKKRLATCVAPTKGRRANGTRPAREREPAGLTVPGVPTGSCCAWCWLWERRKPRGFPAVPQRHCLSVAAKRLATCVAPTKGRRANGSGRVNVTRRECQRLGQKFRQPIDSV